MLVTDSDEYFYSGMVPGVLAGSYQAEQARLRPPRLAAAAGAGYVRARAVRVDAGRRVVHLADGREIRYDLLSPDVGSAMAGVDVPGVREHALCAKPMRSALTVPGRVAAVRARNGGRPVRVVIVGGGAAGTEISLCVSGRYARSDVRLTVIESGWELLAEHPAANRRRATALLGARGVEIRTDTRVAEVTAAFVRTEPGERIACDLVLWATGPAAPALVSASGLPSDDAGYLRVSRSLRVEGWPEVFAAGDCVSMRDRPWVAKAGVYAVREGPVLAANLARHLRSEPLREYEPQCDWLSLLNTGDGRALLARGGVSLRGRPVWWLKDRIDRRFVRRFQRLEWDAV